MNRREFSGTALAGLGGFLLPVKSLFAKNINTISSEELWTEILSGKQYGVKVFLHKPMASNSSRIGSISRHLLRFGLSTTHHYDFLSEHHTRSNGDIYFLFKNHSRDNQSSGLGFSLPTDNMKYIAVCPAEDSYEEDWIFYEHHGDNCWSKIASKTIMPWILETNDNDS